MTPVAKRTGDPPSNKKKLRSIFNTNAPKIQREAIFEQNIERVAAKAIVSSFNLSHEEEKSKQIDALVSLEQSIPQTTDTPTSLEAHRQEKDRQTKDWLNRVTTDDLYKKLTTEELLREAGPDEKTLQPKGKWLKECLIYLALAYARTGEFPPKVKRYIEANKHMRFDDKHAQYIFNQAAHYYRIEKGEKVNEHWKEAATDYLKEYELPREEEKSEIRKLIQKNFPSNKTDEILEKFTETVDKQKEENEKAIRKKMNIFTSEFQKPWTVQKLPEEEDLACEEVLKILNRKCKEETQTNKTVLYKAGPEIEALVTGGSAQAVNYRKKFLPENPENVDKAYDLIYKLRELNKDLIKKDFEINDTHKKTLKEIDKSLAAIYDESFEKRENLKYLLQILRDTLHTEVVGPIQTLVTPGER